MAIGESTSKGNQINCKNLDKNIANNLADIVPVVCDDMFEYMTESGKWGSLADYVCDYFKDYGVDDILESVKENYYYGMSLLGEPNTGIDSDFASKLHEKFSELVKNKRIRLNRIVRDFLLYGRFKMIITTICHPIIENELKEFSRKVDDQWYNPNSRNDMPFNLKDSDHIVYHIFGGHPNRPMVYNEQTLLLFMHALHSEDYGAKRLSHYLCRDGINKPRRLLVLGSILPDWLFRFLVYPMYENQLDKAPGFWLSHLDIEDGLKLFLNRNKYVGKTSLKLGVDLELILSPSINKQKEQEADKIKRDNKLKFFISYKRGVTEREKNVLQRIIELLKQEGEVWLDTENEKNRYWANIKRAVYKCDRFIPIITPRYLKEFREAPNNWNTFVKCNPIIEMEDNFANDFDEVSQFEEKPVVREAYYAVAWKKEIRPIIIPDLEFKLDAKIVVKIAHSKKIVTSDNNEIKVIEPINLPPYMFTELIMREYIDNNPQFFNID